MNQDAPNGAQGQQRNNTRDKVRLVNSFFKTAGKKDVDNVMSEILLSDRQKNVFDMYYIRKLNAGFIADTLNVSYSVIKTEINSIRNKVYNSLYKD